jgi:hypothetical protein
MNIFKSNGTINTDIDPSEIPEARRPQYNALVAAQIMTEQAESNEMAANEAVAEAVRVHDRAHAAVPRSSFLDEWKRMVGQRDNSSVRDNPSVDPLVALKAAMHDLDLARHEARRCREATLAARGAFGKALEAWNRTQPVQTQEQALRDYVNTSQLERARRAAAGQGVYYPGVTRTAKAIGGGGLGVQQGGGRSYRRGAYSKAEAMTIEANKLRAAAAAAKPQSQR